MTAALAQAAQTQLRDAQATISLEGATERYPVQLPYLWDSLYPVRQGQASFELAFALDSSGSEPYAVYMDRSGNAYEVWVNGQLLLRNGLLESFDAEDFSKTPQFFTVPASLLRSENLIRVHIRADAARRAGLSPLWIGPESQIRPRFEAAYQHRVWGGIGVALFNLSAALLALALWLTQGQPERINETSLASHSWLRQADHSYGWAFLALATWGLRVGDVAIQHPPIDWPVWGYVLAAAHALCLGSTMLYCQRIAGKAWLQWGLSECVALGAVVALQCTSAWLAYAWRLPSVWLIWVGLFQGALFVFAFSYGVWAWRQRHTEAKIMAFALLVSICAGLIERAIGFFANDLYGQALWTRYISLVMPLALGAIVVRRFRATSAQARALVQGLQSQVADKEAQLATSFAHLESTARAQERTAERNRILRDMHDGVGANLATAIRQLQTAQPNDPLVAGSLQDAVDHLKLSTDALQLPEGDLNALLAALRYRLAPRLRAAGLELVWDVQTLPALPQLTRSSMQHMQFLLYELLSNTMQHAQATQVLVRASVQESAGQRAICLSIADNGRGLPPDFQMPGGARAGRGLRSLQERAKALGAQWYFGADALGVDDDFGALQPQAAFATGLAVQLRWKLNF